MSESSNKPGSPEAIKASIQQTALLLIAEGPNRYRSFMRDLTSELSAMEQGDLYLQAHEAVQELIDQGQLVLVNYQTPHSAGKLIAPAGFKIV